MSLAVLAATLVDVVDFFPVTFLYGVSKFLFSALALAFCLSLLASFVVAMTVIPLFCSRFLKQRRHMGRPSRRTGVRRFALGTGSMPASTAASIVFWISTSAGSAGR